MAKSPIPENLKDEASRAFSQMSRFCFDGDIDDFHEVFSDYLAKNAGADPFGRLIFDVMTTQTSSPFAFRSINTDPEENRAQSKKRWEAWMSVMPLDMQLSFIFMESSPRIQGMIDPATLKWDQWWDIMDSADPEKAYTSSPMARFERLDFDNTSGQPRQIPWSIRQKSLGSTVHYHAAQLMAWKSWGELEEFMAASRMHARDEVVEFYVHYRDKNSRGSTMVKPTKEIKSLPFWTVGLFCGAHEEDFWKAVHRFGGPANASEAFDEAVNPFAAMSCAQSGTSRRLAPCPLAHQWEEPLSWIEPYVKLADAAKESITRTRIAWMAQAMEIRVEAPDSARRAALRL